MSNRRPSRRVCGKRIAIVVLTAIIMEVTMLNAAVVNITEGLTAGYTMTDGNTYVIQNSVSFSNSTVGGNGMNVAGGATVVLYVPQGVTLTVKGSDGEGRVGGGAGIEVPKTSTLVITGEGVVKVTGGNAGNGGNGESGYNASESSSGPGGSGGAGGGGAGAGIGGFGGTGGAPNGGNGGMGESMGCVYVLGSICIEAFSGLDGRGGNIGSWGENAWFTKNGIDYISGGGGSGGAGGAGSAPSYPIGGGGAAGGAGARGGRGYYGVLDMWDVASFGGNGDSAKEKGMVWDTTSGGSAGDEGDAGTLCVSPEVTINLERPIVSSTTHPVVQHTMIFDANGGKLSSESNKMIATLGCSLPDCISIPIRRGYLFCAWKDENGVEYYDGNGTKMLTSYSMARDVVLHAEWEIDPGRMVVTPADGTIFDGSLTIAMSSSVEGSTIRYTVDGSVPTADSPVYKKFKISEKTTVKAIAFYDDGGHSETVIASYALGQCDDPAVSPGNGTVFKHSGQIITIDKNGEEGVLRYTIDGTEPTRESLGYAGPFTVDDSTIVKAKVFSDRYFDSGVVTVNLTREWETVQTPVIAAAEKFTGSETKVTLACATLGATIRYTTDGSEPNSHSTKYTGSFWVGESCTVKAVAMCAEYRTSEVVSRTITKVWGIGDTMGAPDHAFTTSGDADFFRVDDETAPNKEAMRSGAMGDSAGYGLYSRSVLSSTVQGPCTIKFKWRSSCEQDDDYEWDHAEFAVDGVVVARINDVTEWRDVSYDVSGGGSHVITWSYLKDDSEKEGEDCLWVAEYSWTPTELYTHESSVPVPYDWILSYLPHTPYEYDRFEAAVRETAANGMNTVEEAYIAGLDPSKESSKFMAIITMDENVPTITWSPDLSDDDLPRHYTIYGKRALDGIEDWEIVTDANKPNMRFFKVAVNMP